MGFFVCMKREGDEKGTAEQSEAKNHPVNGFLVPRAGGGTGPVPPDEPLHPHQTKKPMHSMGFFLSLYEEKIRKLYCYNAAGIAKLFRVSECQHLQGGRFCGNLLSCSVSKKKLFCLRRIRAISDNAKITGELSDI